MNTCDSKQQNDMMTMSTKPWGWKNVWSTSQVAKGSTPMLWFRPFWYKLLKHDARLLESFLNHASFYTKFYSMSIPPQKKNQNQALPTTRCRSPKRQHIISPFRGVEQMIPPIRQGKLWSFFGLFDHRTPPAFACVFSPWFTEVY